MIKYRAKSPKGIQQVKQQLTLGVRGVICKYLSDLLIIVSIVTGAVYLIKGISDPRIFIVYSALIGCTQIGERYFIWKLRQYFIDMDFENDFEIVVDEKN